VSSRPTERTITVVNWSDCQHTIEIPYTEDFEEFDRSICLKLRSTLVHFYFLGEKKTLEDRKKLPDGISLVDCLTEISQWRPKSEKAIPELLFHIQNSPTASPDNAEKRHLKNEKLDEKLTSIGSSVSSRSNKFSPMVMKRDDRTCVFCGERTSRLEAAHLFEHRENNDIEDDQELDELLKHLSIYDVDDVRNGLCLCFRCHDGFDADMICIHPDNLTIVVAECLVQSEYFSAHFGELVGRQIAPTDVSMWRNYELLSRRYHRYEEATNRRHQMIIDNPFCCERCNFRCLTASGLNKHQNSKKCFERESKKSLIKYQVTPIKVPNDTLK
jgi:hypothetical protein